jgi:hypothetical protein
MKWITREKVKVDRVACPWLLKKFVDPEAEFLFVPADEVERKARELGATPYDIEGCELGHHGEDVSFNSILKKFKLTDQRWCCWARLCGRRIRTFESAPRRRGIAVGGVRIQRAGVERSPDSGTGVCGL